jgi:hypothetical protein
MSAEPDQAQKATSLKKFSLFSASASGYRLRDGYFYNHTYQDFVMMSILEDEFRESC